MPNRSRSWIVIGLAAALACGGALLPGQSANAAQVVFEAEAAVNTRTGQARVLDRPNASGGQAIGYVGGGNGTVAVLVDVVDPQRTSVLLQWISGENRDVRYTCNDGAEQFLDLPVGPNWSDPQRTALDCGSELTVGENVITLWNTGPAPDIDAIVVDTSQQTRFEAEDPANDFVRGARVMDRAAASGGKVVGYLGGGNGELGLKVSIEAAGMKTFELQYFSGENRDLYYQCPAAEARLLDLAPGATWDTPMRAKFSCYIPQGIHTIQLWNTGPAPDVDALFLVGGIDDGGGDPTTPPPTDPGYPTEDPYADDPASSKPIAFPESTNWSFIDEYSSEFNGTEVDGWYDPFPDEWGWRSEWRWSEDNVAVRDGNLEVKQTYDPTNDYNVTIKGWQTARVDIDRMASNTDSITTYAARSGDTGLRHTYFNAYGARTQQTLVGLSAGTYTFSGWARTEGVEGGVSLVAADCAHAGSLQRTPIPRQNGGWAHYSLAVAVEAGTSCKVGVESTGQTFHDVAMFDDLSFNSAASPANRLANPGFEEADTTWNKSGGVMMKEPVKYGYFEVRAKSGTPYPGTALAFWLDGREGAYSTEMDIVELGEVPNDPHAVNFAAHKWPSSALGPNHISNGGDRFRAPWIATEDFHTYGFHWAPGVQKWYVDGVLRATRTDPAFDPAEQFVILSLGLRAPYVNNPGAYPDLYDDIAPSKFDYVRIWKERLFEVPSTVRDTWPYQSSFVFSDGWAPGATHATSVGGSTWSMRFDGDGVDVKAPFGAGQGTVSYSIDGGEPVVVEHSRATSATVWSSPVLERGKHVITATVLAGPVGVTSATIRNTLEEPAVENRPPSLGTIADTGVEEGVAVRIQATGADPDGGTLTYAAEGLPAGLTIDPATGVISGSTTAVGGHLVSVSVDDGQGGRATVSFTLTVTARPKPSPTPTSPTPSPTTPSPTKPAPPTYVRSVPYTMPGEHDFNGRQWFTQCEPYSQTERCRTEIWASVVKRTGNTYSIQRGWAFNNLTYLPFMQRAQWATNPLGGYGRVSFNGEFLGTDQSRWRTECDTAATGRNACRSYRLTTVYAATPKAGGGYAFSQANKWVFNNIVLFGSYRRS